MDLNSAVLLVWTYHSNLLDFDNIPQKDNEA
jgi:hypothetical protein